MIDVKEHEYHLKRILRDIISDATLNNQLVFKGGTCLYLFYDLGRFSVDLDFNLTGKKFDVEKMKLVLDKYLDLKAGDSWENTNGWLWEASYKKGYRKMQVDVNKRKFPDKYEIKQFYGLSIKVLMPEFLFAHKLCAVLDRQKFQNRDLYDIWFMFENDFPIDKETVELRTGKKVEVYFKELEKYIKNKVKKEQILQGLGELLDRSKKIWVKDHLIEELLVHLKMKREQLGR